MKTLRLSDRDILYDAKTLEGEKLGPQHFSRVVRGDTTVWAPGGWRLLVLARDVLSPKLGRETYRALRWLRPSSHNRGMAAGGRDREAPTDVFGFLDAGSRSHRCRMTGFTRRHYPEYVAALPFFAAMSSGYRKLGPSYWHGQEEFVAGLQQKYVIERTVFSSVQFNVDFQSCGHLDAANVRPGLEVVATLGDFTGGFLVFPRFQVAVDLRPGALLLADMCELHGNTPMSGHRISLVAYARAGMAKCGTQRQEHDRPPT